MPANRNETKATLKDYAIVGGFAASALTIFGISFGGVVAGLWPKTQTADLCRDLGRDFATASDEKPATIYKLSRDSVTLKRSRNETARLPEQDCPPVPL